MSAIDSNNIRNGCVYNRDATPPVSLSVWYNVERNEIAQVHHTNQESKFKKILNFLIFICVSICQAFGLFFAILASWLCFVSIYGSIAASVVVLYMISQFTTGILLKTNYTIFERNIIFITWQQMILRMPLK